MRELTARAYFAVCLTIGRMLRSARYATARIIWHNGESRVLKHRRFYAPLLIWMSRPLLAILDTGMRVLPRADWEARERRLYDRLYGASISASEGALLLPLFAGRTLAVCLEDAALAAPARRRATELAVRALTGVHRGGFTHADAMAENVLVDLGGGVARWFDFETVHDSRRPIVWQRADDLRALVTTCLLRTRLEDYPATLALILDVYADEDVTRAMAASVAPLWHRSLTYHLAQAPLSFERRGEMVRLLARWTSLPSD